MKTDGWKIVKGLEKKNQDEGFKSNDSIINRVSKEQDDENERWEKEWNEFIGKGIFEKSFEEGNIAAFTDFILGCIKRNIPLKGKRGDVSFVISDTDPLVIHFRSEDEKSTVIIADGEVEYSEMEFSEDKKASYRSKKTNNSLLLSRSIYVINCEEINEYYSIKETLGETMSPEKANEIVQAVLRDNPIYLAGNDGEFYRIGIDKNEPIQQMVQDEEILKQYLLPGSETKLGDFPAGFYEGYYDYIDNHRHISKKGEGKIIYGDYIVDAKNFEEHCQYIYSLIMEAYKGIKEKSVQGILTQQETIKKQEAKINRLKGEKSKGESINE